MRPDPTSLATPAANPERSVSLGFLLFPGFPMACLTSAIEPLRVANEIAGEEIFRWTLISETGDAVESSAQISFQANVALHEADQLDMVFLLSGPDGGLADPKSSNGRLRHLVRHGARVGAISGGVFPLARAGLLDGQKCSVHWCYQTAFEDEFPNIETTDDVIVLDQRCSTASGAAAGFDMVLHLIEKTLGQDISTEVACWFQHPVIRSPSVPQKIPAFRTDNTADNLPDMVSRAIRLFSENIEFPLTTQEVARRVGASPRQLERKFKLATGQGPGEYYRLLRMRAARQLVIYSKASLTAIAQSVGYTNSATLSRNYIEQFGTSPRQERQEFNRFRVAADSPAPDFAP